MAVIAADPVAAPASPPPSAAPPTPAPAPTPTSAQPVLTPTVASAPAESAEPDIVDKIGTLSPDQRKYFFSQMNDDQKTRFQQILQQKIAAKHAPSTPTPSLHERFQAAADQMVNQPYLTDESGKPLNGTGYNTGAVGQAERFGMGVMRGGESVLVHPIQTAHSSVEMLRDVARATGSSSEVAGRDPNDPEVKKIVQDARDRLSAQWKHFGDNPAETAGNFVGGGIVSEGLGMIPGGVVKGVRGVVDTVKGSGDVATGSSDLAVGAAKDLQAAGEAQIKARAKYEQDVKEAKADAGTANDNAQKQMLRQYVKNQQVVDQRNQLSQANYEAQTEADKLNHANKVSQITAQNEAAEKAATEATEQRRAEAQQKHAETVQAAQDTESERGELARHEIQARLALMRRAKKVAASAKGAVDQQYAEVRKGIHDAMDSGEVVQPPWSTAQDAIESAKGPLEEADRNELPEKYAARVARMKESQAGITGAIDEAKGMLQGSEPKISVFESILKRANDIGDLESQRRAVIDSRNYPGNSYEGLSSEHKALVDEAIQINDKLRKSGAVPIPEENGTPTASYDHLSGYSTEIGRELRNNPDMDGDIKRALTSVKAHLDAMKQVMADKAGVGQKLLSANKNYSIYRDVFHEDTGPSGSGSPVAKGLKAEEATHATEPYLNKDAEIASRARQMLVGQPFRGPGSYFDPGAGYLVDKLREIRGKIEDLPKNPQEVPPYQEPAAVQPKLKPVPDESSIPVRKPPVEAQPVPVIAKDTAVPKEVNLSAAGAPLDTRQIKLKAYQRMADRLKYIDKWQVRLAASAIGGLITHALGGDWGKAIEGGIGSGAVAAAPAMLGRLMDVPEFRQWISKPRARDFQLLEKLNDADKLLVKDDMTGQIVTLAEAGQRFKVAPEVQAFVGPENILKIAKAISQAKRMPSGGTERLKEAAAQAARGAGTGIGAASAVAAGAQRVETGTDQGAQR